MKITFKERVVVSLIFLFCFIVSLISPAKALVIINNLVVDAWDKLPIEPTNL